MKDFNYFRAIKIWLISIFSLDVVMFLYLFISGRVADEPLLGDFVTPIAGILLAASVIVGVVSVIYATVKKQYIYILHGLGILLGSAILFLSILIIALASIW